MVQCLASVELPVVRDLIKILINFFTLFLINLEYESAAQKATSMIAAMCDVCSNYYTQDANYV